MTDTSYDQLRERLLSQGAATLTTAELLALLLRSGQNEQSAVELAAELLERSGNLQGLAGVPPAALLTIPGMTPNRSAAIIAAMELGRRLARGWEDAPTIIRSAEDVVALVGLEMEVLKQEHLRAVLLDVRRRVIAISTIYIGSLNMTIIRAAEVFREAIARNCASLILVHNHPSGDATPSASDISITEDLAAAGRLLDIAVLDHVIIGQGRWVSLRDTGVQF